MKKKRLSLALLCGGPSPERGISLNSARSVCDHLSGDDIDIVPFYFDHTKAPYQVSRAQLYSNTPSDFDFKLSQSARPLSMKGLAKELKKMDLAFPVIHGVFGEDGELISQLEKWGVPTVGPSSQTCRVAFNKIKARKVLEQEGFYTLPVMHYKSGQRIDKKALGHFIAAECKGKAVVKPVLGGSSIGVSVVTSSEKASAALSNLFTEKFFEEALVEPFCTGIEFTTVLHQNRFGQGISLLPIEIGANYAKGEIFDYRRKYLATNQVTYHVPARFSEEVINQIRLQASQIFSLFGFRDFLRIDGWILKNGRILFSDINPISGMEQNSFFFMASSQVGMSHRDAVRFTIRSACRRNGIEWEERTSTEKTSTKKEVHVLFGGPTAERQVSLMSGTNVWLKLLRSKKYAPIPFLLDKDQKVWRLPYLFIIRHTVEEISELCRHQDEVAARLAKLIQPVIAQLALKPGDTSQTFAKTAPVTLEKFVKSAPAIFNTVHGGIGESGVIQRLCDKAGTIYNGCGAAASQLCMDKYETGKVIQKLKNAMVVTAPKKLLSYKVIQKTAPSSWQTIWQDLLRDLDSKTVIVKPRGDGCSAGIVRLFQADDLKEYCKFVLRGASMIPANTLTNQATIVEMPSERIDDLLFEPFIETDKVFVQGKDLHWKRRSDLVEVTVGVLGKKGNMRAMNPSITIASGDVLSLEEKFQGGTGVNITPPPRKYVSSKVCRNIREGIEKAANALGIEGYSRIDAFINHRTGQVIVIEANTLPGLTGSTVFFHQGLAEKIPVYPTELLDTIMDLAWETRG